jgi:hypothetical protein
MWELQTANIFPTGKESQEAYTLQDVWCRNRLVSRQKKQSKPGDIIKCHDVDEMIELMQELEKEDIHSDFL